MLKLAELLCLAGIQVTFLNSDDNHSRLLKFTSVQSRFAAYPGFRFETIADGLPPDHPRSGDRVTELFDSIEVVMKPRFRDMLDRFRRDPETGPPVTCVIADGSMCFPIGVAKEMGIPVLCFRTISASCFWAFFCIPELIKAGDLPVRGDDDMDRGLSGIPGMETFLRVRDLPAFCRVQDLSDPGLQYVTTATYLTTRSDGLILNTFEDLEQPALSHIRRHIPNIYAIGPLHAHLASRLASESSAAPPPSYSLWKEDRSCIAWLDSQPPRSVVYVSFGSMAILTSNELIEFWHGLVNSGKRFLWVVRPNSIAGGRPVPEELVAATVGRGYVVGWAPQEEVLGHPSVGAFLTHSGWNSTLESISAGRPMICWPYYADQQMNSRFVGDVWRVGRDMKDTCDRATVERMIRDLMDERRCEFVGAAEQMAEMAIRAVNEGGSSYINLDRLIEEVKSMATHNSA
ncbi:7-deoxyloganetic acid glucosyltransferase [Bertholletia excelsa]